jgi:hypothetical protein
MFPVRRVNRTRKRSPFLRQNPTRIRRTRRTPKGSEAMFSKLTDPNFVVPTLIVALLAMLVAKNVEAIGRYVR